MILVDTSVWIEHLRSANAILRELLGDGEVLGHPFVLGELALGNLRGSVTTSCGSRNGCLKRPVPRTEKCSGSSIAKSYSDAALAMWMPICWPPRGLRPAANYGRAIGAFTRSRPISV